MKIKFLFAGVLVVVGLSVASVASAITPVLALSGVGGDSVQLTITGDANSSATLFYNVGASTGAQTSILGMTDSNGQLVKTISVAALNLNTGNQVYVMVNSQQSLMLPWSSTGSSAAATVTGNPVLTQTSVALAVGQVTTIVSQAAASVYMSSNANPSIASVQTNGSQITISGNQNGTTVVSICYVGTSNCTSVSVGVGTTAATTDVVSFSPASPVVAVAGTVTVSISGGTQFYVATNSNLDALTYILNGNTMTVIGKATGVAVLSVCSVSNVCQPLSITVGAAAATGVSSAVSFSATNPVLTVGQSTNITLSGSTTYFVSISSNSAIAQAGISGTILTLTGLTAGSTTVTVCANSGGCSNLLVTVSGGVVTTTTPAPVVTTSAGTTVAVLTQIQTMQSQLEQMLVAIKAMQAQLSQLVSGIAASVSASVSASGQASVTAATSISTFLQLNSTGPEVTLLQQKLTKAGYYSGPVNGNFGPLTEAAVKKYQTAKGIEAAGYVGPSTRAALNAQ